MKTIHTLTTGNGGNTITDGKCLPPRPAKSIDAEPDPIAPLDGGDWLDCGIVAMRIFMLMVALACLGGGIWIGLTYFGVL